MSPFRLIIAVAGAFLSAASFWMSLPLIAVSLRAAGLSDSDVGLISCLPWVGLLVISPLLPRIIRLLGLQRTVLSGMIMSGMVFLGFASTKSVTLWSVLFFLQGGTLALRWAAMDTWINGAVPENSRGSLIGLYELVASGSMAVGPFCLTLFGGLGARPFLACAASAAMAAGLLVAAGPEPKIPARARSRLKIWHILALERTAFVGIGLVGFTEAANLSLLPVFSLSAGTPAHRCGMLVVAVQAGVAAGAVGFGVLADRLSRRAILLGTGCISVLAPLALPFVLGNAALWPVLLTWGLAQGGLFTLGMVLLGARFRAAALAPAIALAMSVYTLGGICGPPLMGWMMSAFGPYALAYGLAGAAFLAVCVASCFEVFRPHGVMSRRDSAERPA